MVMGVGNGSRSCHSAEERVKAVLRSLSLSLAVQICAHAICRRFFKTVNECQ
jgi:hypothetical protein